MRAELKLLFVACASIVLFTFALSAQAQSTTGSASSLTTDEFGQAPLHLGVIRVLGGSREEVARAAAPQRVNQEKLKSSQHTDVNRALRNTAGVYIREEDGQGLRPNIGLRGTNPDRSKKIVMLEDGVLIGPAPYSAPAAYYTPSMNHVESLEVYRGFSAVPHGPNSIGGTINYLSPSVPNRPVAKVASQFGTYSTSNLKLETGTGTVQGHGFLLSLSRHDSKGFKELDLGGDTGFLRQDLLAQGKVNLGSAGNPNTVLLRFGYADEKSAETYLGLSAIDFERKSNRRYSASAQDAMKWRHLKFQAEHEFTLAESTLIRTTAYQHRFRRAWYRLDSFRSGSSEELRDILRNPDANVARYRVLTGAADSDSLGPNGELKIVNNDRAYVSQGVQTRLLQNFSLGATEHDLEFSARWHLDQIDRNHTYDLYSMNSGRLARTGDERQVDTRNRAKANARTFSVQDEVSWRRFVFTGVARLEDVDFSTQNTLLANQPQQTWQDRVFVPGAGILYKLTPDLSIRTSVNRAVTVAGLDNQGGERREESVNYEVGLKYASASAERVADLTAFVNQYRNLTGTCTASTGCSSAQLDQQFSAGRAQIVGLEARLGQGIRLGQFWFPIQLNSTLLRAELREDFLSTSAEWGRGLVKKGSPLPYVPQIQYSLAIGMHYKTFRQELSFNYQGLVYDQSRENGREAIPAYGVIDWASNYGLSKSLELFAKVDNILDKNYAVSLRPFGYRPGKSRSVLIGLNYAL